MGEMTPPNDLISSDKKTANPNILGTKSTIDQITNAKATPFGFEPTPPEDLISAGPKDVAMPTGGYKSMAQRGKEVLGSTFTGGVLGAGSPEILMGAGRVIGSFPSIPTKAAGLALETTGRAMRGSRAAQAGYGALGGGAAGVTQQVGELKGWSPAKITIAELAAGGFAPELAPAINYAFSKGIGKLTGLATRTDFDTLSNKIVQSIEGQQGAPLTSQQKAFINNKLTEMRGGARNLEEPARKTMQAIREGTQAEVQAAEATAAALKNKAQIESLQREQALAATEAERSSIGKPMETAQIGEELRGPISARQQRLKETRQKQFDEDNAVVQQEVSGKEKSGIFLQNDPVAGNQYKNILSNLRDRLLIGEQAMSRTTADVTEQGVLSQYQRVYDALKPQQRVIGKTENGDPIYKTFPVSFNAVDDLRRKLGDAAFGKVAEGYEAIGTSNARQLYKELSDLQASFSPAKKDLISNYEEASKNLNIFKTNIGKKATATESFDVERFIADPSSLPKTFFKTRQSVKDLVDLTGSPAKVKELANNYVAKEIEGKSATQVNTFIKNNEWLREFPDLRYKLTAYQANLYRAEGLPLAEDVLRKAEAEANKITSEARSKAQSIITDKNPVARVQDFIINNQSVALQTSVAPYIIQSEGGREIFTKAVGNVLADQSPAKIKIVFNDSVRPALEASGIVSQNEIQRLTKIVDEIDRTTMGNEKVNRIVKIVNQAILGTIAAKTSPILSPVYGGVVNKLSPF